MLEEVAQAGYAGIEIGAHRFENFDHPGKFLEKAKNAGVEVTGIHTLIEFYLEDPEYGVKTAEFASAVESGYLLFSGSREAEKSLAFYSKLAKILNDTGKKCADKGIVFCYHNHDWEFENGREEYKTLLEQTDPVFVSLAVDVGWIHRAGLAPIEFLKEYRERIRYLHLKDTLNNEWTEVGSGEVDFQALVQIIKDEGFQLAVERDKALENAYESAKIARDYLKSIGI
jgi:sugar phosphate isomerase/epimerase